MPFQRLFQRPHSSFVSRERTRRPGKKRGSYLKSPTVSTVFLTPLSQQNVRNNPGSTRCAWAGSLGMIRVPLGGSVTGARWRIRNRRVAACTPAHLETLHLLPHYTPHTQNGFPGAGGCEGGAAHRRILTGCSAHLWRVQPAAGPAPPAASERGGEARFA